MKTLLLMSVGGGLMAVLFTALLPLLRRNVRSRMLLLLCMLCLLRFVLPLPGFWGKEAPTITLREAPTMVTPVDDGGEKQVQAPTITPQEQDTPQKPLSSIQISQFVPYVWLMGMTAVLSVELYGYARYRRKVLASAKSCSEDELAILRSLSGGKNLGIVRSPLCPVPMLIGPLHPLIILPVHMDERELENVLRHELCHKRLGHLFFKWFALLITALHWFNPAVWVLRSLLEQYCELSCDETVTAEMNSKEKQSYGETLIRLSAGTAPHVLSTAATGSGKEHLKHRLVQIMNGGKNRTRSLLLGCLCALLLCGCGSIVGEKEDSTPVIWTQDKNYYSTDGNTWYTSHGNLAYTTNFSTTDGNTQFLPYATDGNLPQEYNMMMTDITVSTPEELLSALTTYQRITLKSGVYDLRSASPAIHGYSYWKPDGNGGHDLRTDGFFHLILESESGNPGDVTILFDHWTWEVCSTFQLRGLTIEGELTLDNCYNAYYDNCIFTKGAVQLENSYAQTFHQCAFDNSHFFALFGDFLSLENCQFVSPTAPEIYYNECLRTLECTLNGKSWVALPSE